jgi:hypothetical protein
VVWADEEDEEDTDVYVAVRSYAPHGPDELAFDEGDPILVLAVSDDGAWMTGTLRGRTGRFPTSHVGARM